MHTYFCIRNTENDIVELKFMHFCEFIRKFNFFPLSEEGKATIFPYGTKKNLYTIKLKSS